MSSTFSPNLRVELIGTGDQAGTWGSTTNTNLGTLMESAISGYVSVSIVSANQAFTASNGTPDQSRYAVLDLTTTTGANFAVYAPPSPKTYIITNSSAYTASVYNSTVLGNTTAAGTGVAVPAGKTISIWSDGANMAVQIDHLPTLSLTSDLAVIDGGTGASTAADARTNLGLVIGTDVPSPTGTGASGTWAINTSGSSASTTGNAATATILQTARTIGGVSFDGSANINLPGVNTAGNQSTSGNAATATNVAYSGLTGTVPTWNQNTSGSSASTTGNAATATVLQTARTIGGVSFDGSANINLPGVNTAGNQSTSGNATTSSSTTGNAATATVLQTARTIGGVSFDGSANINLPGVNTAGNQNTSGNAATASSVAYTNVTGRPAAGWKQVFSGVIAGASVPGSFFRTWRILYGTGYPAREFVSADSFMFTTAINDYYIFSGTTTNTFTYNTRTLILYPAAESQFQIVFYNYDYPVANQLNIVIYVADTTAVHSLTAI